MKTRKLNSVVFNASRTLALIGFVVGALAAGPGDAVDNAVSPSPAVHALASSAEASIDATFTGAWYDPAQSGHGLFVEILPGNRFLAWWFTFDPAGSGQSWFGGVGTYSGNTATITEVHQETGGRWIPNFDAVAIASNAWGTLTFTFSDRDHGRVDFNSIRGYGTGSMNLTRLTRPAATGQTAASAPGAARWVRTGDLMTPRKSHTATLLPDGRVLVAGGTNANDEILDNAEIYDPVAGTWSMAGKLGTGRILHTATLLKNGKVLVTGGWSGYTRPTLASAELYDPATGNWSPTGTLAVSRMSPSATLLPDGKVLIVGGVGDGALRQSAELFDPDSGTFSHAASPGWGRYAHTATLLQDGKVLIAGGVVPGRGISNDWYGYGPVSYPELYDPAAATWQSLDIPLMSFQAATQLPNGMVLLLAGIFPNFVSCDWFSGCIEDAARNTLLLDPETATWRRTRPLNYSHEGTTATLMHTDKVLVVGKAYHPDGWFPEYVDPSTGAELYDLRTDTWVIASTPNFPRNAHTATLLHDGRVLIAGGRSGDSPGALLGTTEIFVDGSAQAPTIAGMTGAWYDPAQNGHGLFIEVLPDNRFLAWWFAFDPAGGGQAWFGGVGTYSGNAATITEVYQTTGGRWIPNFNAAQAVNNYWGSLRFAFTDCNHGRVDFSSVRGYGTGSMNLTRLTQPAGLTCP